MHVDKYIDGLDGDPYAQFVLSLFRLPAVKAMRWAKDIERSPLFCTWKGKRYRVTGASRLGDVWLHPDFSATVGYQHRANVEACTEWGGATTPPLSDHTRGLDAGLRVAEEIAEWILNQGNTAPVDVHRFALEMIAQARADGEKAGG